MKLVLGVGKIPNVCMFIGEAPGRKEAEHNPPTPFVGPSGEFQSFLLRQFGVDISDFYRTNLVKLYQDGNPDPTPAQIAEWWPYLLGEIEEVQPKLIVAVGRFSAQRLICHPDDKSDFSISLIHGVPHRSHNPDIPSDIILLPVLHPAGGLWNYETRSYIREDYETVASTIKRIQSGEPISVRYDPYAGNEDYRDVTGQQLTDILSIHSGSLFPKPEIIGLDTEGIPSKPWSVQISLSPGTGLVLRCSQPDFSLGIQSLQLFIREHNPLIAMHQASTPLCACYDVVMCRAMGLELSRVRWFDTMYNSYLYRLESQALKTLLYRHCGMEGEDYQELIGNIGRDKQISYLRQVVSLTSTWPKPAPVRVIKGGTNKIKTWQRIVTGASGIIADVESGKETKDGPTDPFKRWEKLDPLQIRQVESHLGPIPEGTLDDIPLDKAIFYSCRDADGTLRLALNFMERNSPRIAKLQSDGMKFLPIIEEKQRNGMIASRKHFESLLVEMQEIVDRIGHTLSADYFGGKPFNPLSRPQVTSLCLRRGLTFAKKTSKGLPSTSEKSIGEHYGKDEAITLLFDWRKAQHNRDTYCTDVLERIPAGEDLYSIHANFKPATVHTRRLSSENPNILAVPSRTKIGIKIRHGYKAPPGKIFLAYDLSGIEMRCMAHESKDKLLCKVFLDHIHPHKDTAMRLFHLPSLDSVSSTQKAVGKETNFLTIYGGAYKRLYEELRSKGVEGYDLLACKNLIIDYFKIYSGVKEYSLKVSRECKKTEIVYDHWGMARYLPGINCGDRETEEEECRAAVSQKIQGLAQGMIQNSMIWLAPIIQDMQDSGDEIDWRLLVHDELVFTIPDEEELKQTMDCLVMEALTKHAGIELIVPIEAEAHSGYTWGNLK